MKKEKFKKAVKVEKLAKEIELATGLKLMAEKEDDTVHGYINTNGEDVEIHMYESAEECGPGCSKKHGEHKSTLRSKAVKPTKAALEAIIQAHVK